MGSERTSYNLSCCSSTRLAFLLSFCMSRVSWANVRAQLSRDGNVERSESSEEESDESDDDRVDVVVWRDRNVGYDVWHSVVRAFVN